MEQKFAIKLKNGEKIRHTNIIFKRVKIKNKYFLEFGKHKIGDYNYIALLYGDISYYGGDNEFQKELYFAFKHNNGWRILDETCTKLIEDYKSKTSTINRLIELMP